VRLADKIAIVTGGAQGIGRAIAEMFARERAAVVVADIQTNLAQAVAGTINEAGGRAVAHAADVTQAADVTSLVEACVRSFGRIDILVNNAGLLRDGDVVDTDEATWDLVISANLKSVFLCSRAAIPHMRRQGGGVILNISSSAGWVAGPRGAAAYAASKFGVTGLTKAMACDHLADSIRVNAICPGPTDTPLLHLARPGERWRALQDRLPSKRLGLPEEVAAAAVFLCSDEASAVTGVAFPVDQGYTARL
jgi:NAD(P)-dependent dehydrogenase (short-subunit alcohol dehydrogenase family)